MIHFRPDCEKAQRLGLPERISEQYPFPNERINELAKLHHASCIACQVWTAMKHGRDLNIIRTESKSSPGTFHITTVRECSCQGFGRHGHCKHYDELIRERTDAPREKAVRCKQCGTRTRNQSGICGRHRRQGLR